MELQVKDLKTKEVFRVSPVSNTEFVVTRDGVRVRLHPIVIKNLVKAGQQFDGHTQLGPRPMVKL